MLESYWIVIKFNDHCWIRKVESESILTVYERRNILPSLFDSIYERALSIDFEDITIVISSPSRLDFFFLVYDRRWYCLKNCSRSFRLSLVHKSFVCNNRKRNAKTSMRSEQNENYSSISFYNQVKTIELFHFFSLSSAFGIFHIYIQIRRIRNIVDYFQFNCCNASALVI